MYLNTSLWTITTQASAIYAFRFKLLVSDLRFTNRDYRTYYIFKIDKK